MDGLSRREKYHAFNTLAAVPLLLIGKSVLIDMNNETSVAGRITNADGFLNITLEEIVFIDQKNMKYEMDNMLIPARNIRQVHIGDADIEKEIQKFFNKTKDRNRPKKPKEKTFKSSRAIRKHKEILNEIRINKQN